MMKYFVLIYVIILIEKIKNELVSLNGKFNIILDKVSNISESHSIANDLANDLANNIEIDNLINKNDLIKLVII